MGEVQSQLPNELADLLAGRQLVIASSRGPYTFEPQPDGRIAIARCGGGLVTAMLCVAEASAAIWICAASTPHDRSMAEKDPLVGLPPGRPVFEMQMLPIPESVYDRYYNVIANPLLWFVQHYIWDLSRQPILDASTHKAWTEGYVAFNEAFADAIWARARASADPLIMVQDYHLFLCPAMLRARGCKARIVHFTHIPWPQPDYLRVLPSYMRKAILDGMLSADVVGFHTQHYVQNFLWTCEQAGDYEIDWASGKVRSAGGLTAVRHYPISISASGLREQASSADVQDKVEALKPLIGDCAAIVRIDRADPTKNILRGFVAYRALLKSHPELTGKVRFLSMLYTTRMGIEQYRTYLAEIRELVASINAEFGTADWEPIHLRVADEYLESVAAMRLYDVLLVNPVFDGMNLIAKEGPTVNEKDGVLVLSENAGARDEISNFSIAINPFDCEQTAQALYAALTMDKTQRAEWAASLRNIVGHNDSVKWLYHQLNDVDELTVRTSPASRSAT